MKVAVAIPCLDYVATDFCMSLAAMLGTPQRDRKLNKNISVSLLSQRGSLVMDARNRLVQLALEAEASHILFIDSDMVFPALTLERLAAHHVPIVGCDATRRDDSSGLIGLPDLDYSGLRRASLIPMRTLGFGCILISMKVFPTLPRPYFFYSQGPTDSTTVGEDTMFCYSARSAGHTIWCDRSINLGHVGSKVYRA